MSINLNIKDHSYIKAFLNTLQKQCDQLDIEYPINAYKESENKKTFLLRINTTCNYRVFDTDNNNNQVFNYQPKKNAIFNKMEIKIKNVWAIEHLNIEKINSGLVFQLINLYL